MSAEQRIAELGSRRHQDGTTLSAAGRRSIHRLATAPPEADRIGRWRTEMAAEQIADFEAVAGFMLKELGY